MAAVNYRAAFFYFVFLVLVPVLRANIAEYDEVWRRRAAEAKKAIDEAYHPNPHEVVEEFNKHVHHHFSDIETNSTRRSLRGGRRAGPCQATNPIDRCWRCQPDWATNRKRLADCALGFGHRTTGGKDGEFYVVTDASDDDILAPKPGTLRHAVIQPQPLWITFAHDMIIRLKEELLVTSNKTIDGRGANVRIAFGAQITLQFVQNVIIHNLHVHDIIPGVGGLIRDSVNHFGFRTKSDGDGISIFGSTNIWIDHMSMSHCSDGLIDAVMASTGITISNSHFTHHNEVMLFGGSNIFSDDKKMQITLAFNHFGVGLVQRMPRCRWGFIHVVNNDYTHWLMYAIGGNQQPTIISQGNRFIAPMNDASKEVTKREYTDESQWKTWQWQSQNDLMMNGAFFVNSGSPIINVNPQDVITAKPGTFVTRLTRYSGALGCIPNMPC